MAEFQFYNELNPRAKNKKKLKYKSRKMVLKIRLENRSILRWL